MTIFVMGNAAGVIWVRIAGDDFTLMLFPSVILPIFVGIVILLTYKKNLKLAKDKNSNLFTKIRIRTFTYKTSSLNCKQETHPL